MSTQIMVVVLHLFVMVRNHRSSRVSIINESKCSGTGEIAVLNIYLPAYIIWFLQGMMTEFILSFIIPFVFHPNKLHS